MVGKEQGITVVALCLTYDFFIVHKVQRLPIYVDAMFLFGKLYLW